MMADNIQAPQDAVPDEALSFDSDGIEAELAFLQGVLEQAESALGASDLAEVPMLAVGGIDPSSVGPWLAAGANGFGLGSALYRPGKTADEVAHSARACVAALRESAA